VSSSQRVLILTNDDGVDAPGLSALFQSAIGLGERRVIAPLGPQSGCGHRVTTDGPVRVQTHTNGWLGVDGTPADCVRLALHHLEPRLEWVLSGINSGANLGADLWHSGTVAAVREAVLHGKAGVAFSQYIARGRAIDWGWTAALAAKVLPLLVSERQWESGTFWNVNFPYSDPGAVEPEVVFCPVDPSPLPLLYRLDGDYARYAGDYHNRPRRPGHDVDVCFGGRIAVSLVRLLPG
jgi:5'-nucleotidase